MNIGVPKEHRPFEFRVGCTPAGAKLLTQQGQTVYVEHDAGKGVGFSDKSYADAGANIVYSAREAFGRADLVLKVSRPTYEEINWLMPGAILAGFLHFASSRQDKIDLLLQNQITTLAYEQIELPDGTLPVLRPLSQIGGRMAAQIGARLLQNDEGGKGILLGGIASVPPAEVVIIGAGVVGTNAARAFLDMGAHVTILDTNLAALQAIFDQRCGAATMISNPLTLARAVAYADIVVGAVLVKAGRAPIVVTREMVKSMKPRSVVMDISIDEGGCVETSRPTTHEHPTFIEEGIIHYCVPNIPSLVARTATYAFLNAASPFIMPIVSNGLEAAMANNLAIECGLNTYQGELRHLSRLTTKA
jgi:alanine dehydrogenase